MLNPAQQKAVTSLFGPVLVVAGAGTGKTRVLEYRTIELIQHNVDPRSILLLTFTRRAAAEMLARAAQHDVRARDVSGGTFHSFSLEMIKRYGSVAGISTFTVLDQGDSEDAVAKVIRVLGLREKKYFPKKHTVLSIISKASNKDVPIEAVIEDEYPHLFEWRQAIDLVASKYTTYKRDRRFMDFDDLLSEFYRMLVQYPGIRFSIQKKYAFIMVDEFQDTNKIQGKIVHALAETHKNILIVGDEMQSIYKFRGAEFTNMINFPRQFDGTAHITLEENYRSTQAIIDVANHVLDQVEGVSFKKFLTAGRTGPKPEYAQFKSPADEAQWIGSKILSLSREDIPLRHIAVLTRSGYHTAQLEIELASLRIPFKKFGGIRFIETAHVKDVVAHLKVIVNPRDELSWRRILLLIEGVGEKTVDSMLVTEFTLPHTGKFEKLSALLATISQPDLTPSQKIADIVEYYKPILRGQYDDYPQREQDLDAFIEIAREYKDDTEFLNDVALDPPDHSAVNGTFDDNEYVTISTIHSAKGLEWHSVFVLQLQDGKFPIVRDTTKQDDIEEERRLFYVAVTRAKERLFLTSSHSAGRNFYESWYFTRPSRFIEQLLKTSLIQIRLLPQQTGSLRKQSYQSDDEMDIDAF